VKIVFISEGKSVHTQRWVIGLANYGCDLHLISSSRVSIPNVKLYHIPIYSRNPLKQLANNFRIKKIIQNVHPDIIHLFGLFSVSSLGSMGLIRNLQNLVISVWGSDVIIPGNNESFKEKIIKKYIINRAECLVATSRYLARTIQSYQKQVRTIETLPWGVDLDTFRPCNLKNHSNTITIGFAKRLHLLSGPDMMLDAFKYATARCKKALKLKVAGDGPLKSKLMEKATMLGLDGSIEWIGKIQGPEKMGHYYRSLDLFIMPSRRESYGVSAVEASATALPVVASDVGGIKEIVINNETGILIKPEDVAGFGEAIVNLAENRALRNKMGFRGREIVEKNFDWKITIKRIMKIYNTLIEK
jgi:glycosyltransferase involved in cell wall biosynthesis